MSMINVARKFRQSFFSVRQTVVLQSDDISKLKYAWIIVGLIRRTLKLNNYCYLF